MNPNSMVLLIFLSSKAWFYLKAFAFAISSTWTAFLADNMMVFSLTPLCSSPKCQNIKTSMTKTE